GLLSIALMLQSEPSASERPFQSRSRRSIRRRVTSVKREMDGLTLRGRAPKLNRWRRSAPNLAGPPQQGPRRGKGRQTLGPVAVVFRPRGRRWEGALAA